MDADKIKEFFILHVEKMILVLVLAASAYMVHAGLQKEDITQTYQPDRLIDDANQVKAGVDENHNDNVLKDRDPKFDITAEIIKRRAPVDPRGFGLKPYEPTSITSGVKRQDPRLIAPRAVRAKGVLTSIAVRSDKGSVYPIADLAPADPLEVVKKEPVKKRKPRRGRGMMDDMDEDMSEMMEMMGSDMGSSMMESDMGMMGMDEGSMSAGANRKFAQAGNFGMPRPGTTKHILNDTPQEPIPGVGYFIAGTAVVPYKELYESYRAALADADDYRPTRDQPIFSNYEVQRADVTDKTVDQLVDADWVVRDNRKDCIKDAVTIWSGFAPEIVSKEYREDSKLTMWIPPVLLDDYSTFALHPLIPMKTPAELAAEAEAERLRQRTTEIALDSIAVDDATQATASSRGMDMMGMDDDSGMGMGMGGYASTRIDKNPVDYKLIRFYDFAVDPFPDENAPKEGRKYVYRVRVSLLDPNFPKDRRLQPKGSILASKVYDRVSAAEKAEEKVYIRWSDWSEPSEPTSLPGYEQFYAGPVTATPKQYTVGSRTVQYQASPAGKMVVAQFNPPLAARMPMLIDVNEGTVLSKKAEAADIVDPITLNVKKVENAEIISGATIVDIDGGLPLEIEEGETMLGASGLMLLFDPNGGLRVHDEAGDQEFYRIKSFADERGE